MTQKTDTASMSIESRQNLLSFLITISALTVLSVAAVSGLWLKKSNYLDTFNAPPPSNQDQLVFTFPLLMDPQSAVKEAIDEAQIVDGEDAETDKELVPDTVAETTPPAVDIADVPELAAPATSEASIPDLVPELQEDTQFGPLPVIKSDGTTAFKAYQSQGLQPVSAPFVAFKDFGLSAKRSAELLPALPKGAALIVSPYITSDITALLKQARALNHEIWLELPLQPANARVVNPGNLALLADLTPEQATERLHSILGRITGYAGLVILATDSPFLQSAAAKPVFADIEKRGLAIATTGTLPADLASMVKIENIESLGQFPAADTLKTRKLVTPLNKQTIDTARDAAKVYNPLSAATPQN